MVAEAANKRLAEHGIVFDQENPHRCSTKTRVERRGAPETIQSLALSAPISELIRC
jgi:hypothetical protein